MDGALRIAHKDAVWLEGETFRGVFLGASDTKEVPVVILVPGLDSSQIEFASNAAALRRRGLSTLTIDGPGQGILAPFTHPRVDYEVVVSDAIDALLSTGRRPSGFGILALSLGGFYGARALAYESRLLAGVTVSGPSKIVWRDLPPLLKEILVLRTGSAYAAEVFSDQIDLTDLAPSISQPLLVVDGQSDVIPGYASGEFLAAKSKRGQYLPIPQGDHLVGNARWKWLPIAADFLKEQLVSRAG